jgi:hypothetical protein
VKHVELFEQQSTPAWVRAGAHATGHATWRAALRNVELTFGQDRHAVDAKPIYYEMNAHMTQAGLNKTDPISENPVEAIIADLEIMH